MLLEHHPPLPLTYSGVAQQPQPWLSVRPHTSKNQLALPSNRAQATLESVSSCVKQAFLTQSLSLPPTPAPLLV